MIRGVNALADERSSAPQSSSGGFNLFRFLGEVKAEMKKVLGEIQDGTFARRWLTENNAAGRANFLAERRIHAEHPIEEVGAELRGMMSWLKDGADLRKD